MPSSDPNEYDVDHSTYVFLMDREGKFSSLLHSNDTVEKCVGDIRELIRRK